MSKWTYGEYLRAFARSADIVDKDIEDQIWAKIRKYLENDFQVTCTLLVPFPVGGELGLKTEKGWGDDSRADSLKNPSTGEYLSQVSLAFDQSKSLWIVDEEGRVLSGNDRVYVDEWTATPSSEIPKYESRALRDTYTSVIIPLRQSSAGTNEGVVNFELGRCEHNSSRLRKELEVIAEVIRQIYTLRLAHETRINSSKQAIGDLPLPSDFHVRSIVKPKIFFAAPEQGDPEVVESIKNVFDRCKAVLDYYYWGSSAKLGSIKQELLTEIIDCQYGICYFSEQNDKNAGPRFRDNLNVVFEAGMLNALAEGPHRFSRNWIPIREEESGEIPFDLQDNRLLMVPRDGRDLKEKAFEDRLMEKIGELIDDPDVRQMLKNIDRH